jgi:hypothetical protein
VGGYTNTNKIGVEKMVNKHEIKRNSSQWRLALLMLLLLMPAYSAFGQGYEEWSKDIGGADTEHFKAIQETSDSGFMVAGYVEPWTRDDHDQRYTVTRKTMTPTMSCRLVTADTL